MKNFFKTAGEIIKEFATRNWGMKLISVLLAFLVWCSVVAGTNPQRIKTVSDVPLRVEGTKELEAKGFCVDTLLSQIPDTVSVSVKAGVDYHRLVTNSTVSATVNLSSIDETGEISMNIECASSVTNSSISAVSPSQITLTIDKLATKSVPVSAKLTEAPRGDYYVSNVGMKNEVITISGPESRISQVAEAVAYIDASSFTQSKSISVPVTFLDADGDELNNIELKNNDGYAIADVEVLPVKEITISSSVIENAIINVANGYEVYGAVSTPSKVRIAGDKAKLDEIEELSLELIDAQEANKSVVLDATLKAIDDIVFVDGNKLSVYVQIREQQETITLRNLHIDIKNAPEDKKASIEDDVRCTITITGGRSAVAALSRDDIKPYVDLYGQTGSRILASVKLDDLLGIDDDDISLSVGQVYVVLD